MSAAGGVPASHGSVSVASPNYTGSVQDDYALSWVNVPPSGSYNLTLSNTSAGGQLRATVACNTGSAVAIAAYPALVGPGQSATLTVVEPSGCANTPVAVITNEAQPVPNPTSSVSRSFTLSRGAASGPVTIPTVPPRLDEGAPDNSPAPPPPVTGPDRVRPAAVADTVRPVISRLRLSSRRFRAARSGAAIAAARRASRVRFGLSESAAVTVRFERRGKGRRWRLVRGAAKRSGRAGANSFRVTGRLRGRSLRPGTYRLRLSARDAARNTSKTRRSAAFRIVRR